MCYNVIQNSDPGVPGLVTRIPVGIPVGIYVGIQHHKPDHVNIYLMVFHSSGGGGLHISRCMYLGL